MILELLYSLSLIFVFVSVIILLVSVLFLRRNKLRKTDYTPLLTQEEKDLLSAKFYDVGSRSAEFSTAEDDLPLHGIEIDSDLDRYIKKLTIFDNINNPSPYRTQRISIVGFGSKERDRSKFFQLNEDADQLASIVASTEEKTGQCEFRFRNESTDKSQLMYVNFERVEQGDGGCILKSNSIIKINNSILKVFIES